MNTTTNTRGASEAMVERAWCAYDHAIESCDAPELSEKLRVAMRAALEAALSPEPAAQGEAVAWQYRRIDEEEGPSPHWHYMTREQYEMFRDNPRSNCQIRQLYTAPPAQPAECVPEGEVRLWDTQWMNIVNHDNCYRDWDKADAINHAVKMTEQAIARNVADGKLPSARITASPAPSEGGKGAES